MYIFLVIVMTASEALPGFGVRIKQKKDFQKKSIKHYFSDTSLLRRSDLPTWSSFVQGQREFWDDNYLNRKFDDSPGSIAELLTPQNAPFHVIGIDELMQTCKIVNPQHKGIQKLWQSFKGQWCMSVDKQTNGNYDFTISVHADGVSRFHSEAIKRRLIKNYGVEAFNAWRQIVLSDLPSLQFLVDDMKTRIRRVHASVTCTESATRLCQRVGIPVKNDIAFLIPSSN